MNINIFDHFHASVQHYMKMLADKLKEYEDDVSKFKNLVLLSEV